MVVGCNQVASLQEGHSAARHESAIGKSEVGGLQHLLDVWCFVFNHPVLAGHDFHGQFQATGT